MTDRGELVARVKTESRRHYAVYALFNQAMASRMGLHPTDLQCLSLLEMEDRPLGTGEIARLTGLTPGAATRLVDRLEKAGFAERRADPADRRRALVVLAPEAVGRLGEAWDGPGRAFRELLASFPDEQLVVIEEFLRRGSEVGLGQVERLRAGGAGSARLGVPPLGEFED
ncbi:MarR family winged helix-turn-helix transcriptional regulator [Streptomyces luteireticuli]|uniref:MarR family winged helix-turn-helix transcriptional regulator n=1 Tax=Streptomyces luteireticuli TaxID=173858 RepID=UPI003557C0FC